MNIRDTHRKALEKYKEALSYKEEGKDALYLSALKESLKLEKSAANILKEKTEAEPTRSVLYRSAAIIAKLLGKEEEAYNLAIEGLKGTPFNEIKEELEGIISTTKTATLETALTIPKLDKLESESEYLTLLRDKAVELKLEESSPKFGGAVAVSNILSFLKDFQSSYKNFAEISFKKALKDVNIKKIEKECKKFKNSVNLLAVNLNFQSFGISIASDDGTMDKFVNHTKEYKEMRSILFAEFKKDVVYPNYNDESFKNRIAEKYTEAERNAIFSPILTSISKKGYNIYLTENNYSSRLKSFSNLSEGTKKFLKPIVDDKHKVEDTLTLTQTVIEKIGNKTTTLQHEQLKKFEKEVTVTESAFKNKKVVFTHPYVIQVFFEEGNYNINDDKYKIDISDSSYDRILNSYHAEFIQKYDKLLNDKKYLSDDDIRLLEDFENIGLRNW